MCLYICSWKSVLADLASVWQLVTSCNRMREMILHLQLTACLHGGKHVCQSGVTQWHKDFCSWVNIVLNRSGHFAWFLTQILKIFLRILVAVLLSNFMLCLHSETCTCVIGFFCHFVVHTVFCFCTCYFFLHSVCGGKWCHWVIKMTFFPIANSQLLLWFIEERAPFIVSFRTLVDRLIQLWEFQRNCGVVFNATHTYQHIYFLSVKL